MKMYLFIKSSMGMGMKEFVEFSSREQLDEYILRYDFDEDCEIKVVECINIDIPYIEMQNRKLISSRDVQTDEYIGMQHDPNMSKKNDGKRFNIFLPSDDG